MITIDVAEKFRSQDYPSYMKDSDYTNHPAGKEDVHVKVQGIISQTGLHKRAGNKLQEKVALNNNQMPLGKNKPVQNVGILFYVDNFFNWLNRNLGG